MRCFIRPVACLAFLATLIPAIADPGIGPRTGPAPEGASHDAPAVESARSAAGSPSASPVEESAPSFWRRLRNWPPVAWARRHRARALSIAFVLAHLAGAALSVRAILDARTAQGTVAWVVALNAMPVLSIPVYWLFGRNSFRGYVKARRAGLRVVDPITGEVLAELRAREGAAPPDPDGLLQVGRLARMPATRGNRVDLLVDGAATYASMADGIDRARNYVLFQTYILRDDEAGQDLADRLLARAADGVRCHLLYDGMGSVALSGAYLRRLREGGVRVAPFESTRGGWLSQSQINFRNHRKVLVVDGREAWIGGHNIGNEQLGRDPRYGAWRDTHVRAEGPVVQTVQIPFLEDWHWATGEILGGLAWTPAPEAGGMTALCLPTGPADTVELCTLFLVNAIHAARDRLWIATPYFVPDEPCMTALRLAALRGVDVRLLVPARPDLLLVALSGWERFERLLPAGIRIYRYREGFMHQKVLLVDDRMATVGTVNFDNRSFRLNFEVTLAVADPEFAGEAASMLERDFDRSEILSPEDLVRRGRSRWFLSKAASLLAPIQ